MLAYELYRKNKDSKSDPGKNPKPLRKIFVYKDEITMDPKLLEEYGKSYRHESKLLQEWLSMPLNTADASKLNLPDRRTGSRSLQPYVQIYGTFEITKSKQVKIKLKMGPKDKQFTAELIFTEKEITNEQSKLQNKSLQKDVEEKFSAEGELILNIDRKNYCISKKNLFDAYIESGILDKNSSFKSKTFKRICKSFFQFARERPDIQAIKTRPVTFSLFVLPDNGSIEYVDETMSSEGQSFVDCFGNTNSAYPSKPTKTAKFLSYDDPAFPINCKQREDFYKNLSIGKTSLEKINLPSDIFKIAGLFWIFTDISDPTFEFTTSKLGIYSQLYDNYQSLKKKVGSDKTKSQLKIVCYKKTQQKLEILIDENMTMSRMEELFENVKNPPPFAFEVLIDSSGKKPIWNDYIKAVNSLITGVNIDRLVLVTVVSKFLKEKIHSWIKENNVTEPVDFFKQTTFCLETLSKSYDSNKKMTIGEDYAYNIGNIAGKYILFKREAREDNNSLKDILTYAKYDREKLRFVMSRVGLGVNLSKADQHKIDEISHYIKEKQPPEEIPDSDAFNDYSYFFFKGVYENVGGSNNG